MLKRVKRFASVYVEFVCIAQVIVVSMDNISYKVDPDPMFHRLMRVGTETLRVGLEPRFPGFSVDLEEHGWGRVECKRLVLFFVINYIYYLTDGVSTILLDERGHGIRLQRADDPNI